MSEIVTTDEQGAVQGQSDATQLAVAGWRSKLARFVVALLVVESITGLWIYLAPFSVSSQVQVLLHTVLGLILLGPYLWYQARHWGAWYRQNMTAVMMLGYALMLMVLVCVVSGVVLTWQAGFGRKISAAWDMVHLVTGVATFVILIPHLVFAWVRRRAALERLTAFSGVLRRFVLGSGAGVVGMIVLVLVLAGLYTPEPVDLLLPEGYTLPAYAQQFDEYRGSPFAPTYARTASGGLVNPAILSGSASCGTIGCHEQILAEWEPSAHRFSALNAPFQQVQKNFAAEREPAETRYCAGCHDPISLFAGAKDIQNQDLSAPGMQEGSSCVVCHTISSVDQRGNADYVLTPPKKYLWETTEGLRKFVSDFVIRSYPRQHLADYDRNLLRTPEFCGACHKQFIPEALNRFGVSPGQNQYDEWRKSHWHVDDVAKDLSCRDCHMRLVYDSTDPGRGEAGDTRRSKDDGAHRHHGMIGTNMFMPALHKLPNWEKHVTLTREWMEGKTVIPEIEDVWPAGPITGLQIIGPDEAKAGEDLTLKVVVENRKIGHNFTTGPLDFTRAWVHLTVTDAQGRVLQEWGGIDPNTRQIMDEPGKVHEIGNSRKEGTMVFEALPLNDKGEPIVRHELWEKAGGKGLRVVFPRYSDSHDYTLTPPKDVEGPLTVRAELNFRRYRQEFLHLVLPGIEEEHGVFQPTVTQTSEHKEIAILRGEGVKDSGR